MKFNFLHPKYLLSLGAAMAATLFIQSCDMINEDMPECASYPNTITKVDFVYDYNMFREDLFNEHAGTAHLYVFNSDSVFLFDRAISKVDMTGSKVDFSMTFDTTELKIGRRYLMVAMAQGNHAGYEWSTIQTPGFQIPLDREMVPGVSKLSDYRIMLDRDSDSYADIGIVNYKDAYGNNQELMDTLWSTKPNQIQTVDIPYIALYPRVEEWPVDTVRVQIPMMRITNAIKVNLVHDSFTPDTDVNAYNILIDFPNGNGTIGFTGQTFPNRELFYRSLRKEMKVYMPKQNGAQYEADKVMPDTKGFATRANDTYCVESQFGVSRLQTTDGSSLQVRNARDNSVMVQIDNFSEWLANYFNNYYKDGQELLDREYNWTIDIHLDDNGQNDWIQVGCAILGWGKRIYFYDL